MPDRRTGFGLLLIMLVTAINLRAQTAQPNLDLAGISSDDKQRSVGNMASTYVPLDSWVYPAFDRLAALGYVQTAFVALRPWTRMECARLLEETSDRTADEG